jgi:hypothetical protein
LYLDLTLKNLQVRAGRQRINWGQSIIWNPNDLFNSYSFFDFDYIEKPGCDAIRIQYYPQTTTTMEFAINVDSGKKITSALLYRFNLKNYDIQILGGIFKGNDIVIGTGWSGNIKNAAFRGEISYFSPYDRLFDTTGILVCSVGSDYTFSNSLSIRGEVLYNRLKSHSFQGFTDFYNSGLSAKNLSFSEYSMLLGISYPITPLLNTSVSAMYFPDIHGYFVGPEITCSLTDNIDFTLTGQTFGGEILNNKMEFYHLIFVRLKWNF